MLSLSRGRDGFSKVVEVTDNDGAPKGFRTEGLLGSATTMLSVEVDEILASNHWAIINTGSDTTQHRLYDAAALRHTCDVPASIMRSTEAADELAVRTLGRAHVEAWLTAVYLHFGGHDALQRIASDTLYETQLANDAVKRQNDELGARKRKAAKSSRPCGAYYFLCSPKCSGWKSTATIPMRRSRPSSTMKAGDTSRPCRSATAGRAVLTFT